MREHGWKLILARVPFAFSEGFNEEFTGVQ
jgi:hypothetical protein